MEIKRKQKIKISAAGAMAGIINGFFGGGGGMVLVPALSTWSGLSEKQVFATSVAITLPMCICSALVYLLNSSISFHTAFPYIIGGLIGGFIGGTLYKRVPAPFLRRVFALFMIYGGIRSLL